MQMDGALKPVRWVGTSLRDLRSFPHAVRIDIGHALFTAQEALRILLLNPSKALAAAAYSRLQLRITVMRGEPFIRCAFPDAIYVLHVFQKKSTKGIATPAREINLIRQRLAEAERDYVERQN